MMSEFSFDEAKKNIYDTGFYAIENPKLGSRFAELRKHGSSLGFSEEAGFDFCREFVLLDPVSLPPTMRKPANWCRKSEA